MSPASIFEFSCRCWIRVRRVSLDRGRAKGFSIRENCPRVANMFVPFISPMYERPRYVSVDFPSSPEAEYLSSASYIKQTFKLHSRTQSVTGGGAFFWAETGRPIPTNASTKNIHCPTHQLIANQEHLFDTPTPPNAMRANEKTRHSNNDVFFVTF